jgi:hypothetical protein
VTTNPYKGRREQRTVTLAGTLREAGVDDTLARHAATAVERLTTGRPEPVVTTLKLEAARRHRAKAFAQRNGLVAAFARLWGGHVMPVGDKLDRLDRNRVICIHAPVGQLCYVVTTAEVDAHFADLPKADPYVNHWNGTTQAQRTALIGQITAASIAPAPAPAKKRATPKKRAAKTTRTRKRTK